LADAELGFRPPNFLEKTTTNIGNFFPKQGMLSKNVFNIPVLVSIGSLSTLKHLTFELFCHSHNLNLNLVWYLKGKESFDRSLLSDACAVPDSPSSLSRL